MNSIRFIPVVLVVFTLSIHAGKHDQRRGHHNPNLITIAPGKAIFRNQAQSIPQAPQPAPVQAVPARPAPVQKEIAPKPPKEEVSAPKQWNPADYGMSDENEDLELALALSLSQISPITASKEEPKPAQPQPAQVKKEQPKPEKEEVRVAVAHGECLLCLEEKDLYNATTQCNHAYCHDCLTNHIALKMREQTTNALNCPQPGCRKALTQEDVASIAGKEQAQRFNDIQFKEWAAKNSNIRQCPKPGCPMMFEINQKQIITCTKCNTSFCSECTENHPAAVTCAEYKVEKAPEDEATRRWKQAHNIKHCPQCHVAIEYTGGCPRIDCERCYHKFCFRCLKAWPRHPEDDGPHHSHWWG